MKQDLGIKSEILVPLNVDAERRGVLLVSSSTSHCFTTHDLPFLEAVTHWVGVVLHRAELVEQHTREATEQAKRLAAEEILTVMAHDLHNYLTPLKGRLDLLKRRARREMQETYVRELQAVDLIVLRLNGLISNLLDVSRLKQGLFSLQRQPIDLVELVEDLVPIWRTSEHAIEIQAPEQLILIADRDRLAQVIENLLSNATTYAEPNTPIHVTLTQEQRMDGLWAILTVSNRGPAIPPEQLESMFQPFVKGAHSQGLGLGLWVSQRIAQAHQGMITVRTEAGTMKRFILSLPLQGFSP
nr:ATP-binding protein [Ktedonobacter racemifer]